MKMSEVNIIIEGCDCTGKSSLAKILMNRFPEMKMIKLSNPENQQEGEMQSIQYADLLIKNTGYILDRGLLGECVYAPLKRKYYPRYMRDLEKKLPMNVFLFLLHAENEIVEARFDNKFIKAIEIPRIQDDYLKEFFMSNYKNKYILNSTFLKPTALASLVEYIIYETEVIE